LCNSEYLSVYSIYKLKETMCLLSNLGIYNNIRTLHRNNDTWIAFYHCTFKY